MNVGMVFGIIFAVIVVVFLLAGGMKMITDLLGFGELGQISAQMERLGNTIRDEVYWLPIGGSQPFDFSLTQGTARVCFFDYLDPAANPDMGWEGNNVIEYHIRQMNYTVYYFLKDGQEDGHALARARVLQSFCTQSSIRLMLISRGSYVEIVPAAAL